MTAFLETLFACIKYLLTNPHWVVEKVAELFPAAVPAEIRDNKIKLTIYFQLLVENATKFGLKSASFPDADRLSSVFSMAQAEIKSRPELGNRPQPVVEAPKPVMVAKAEPTKKIEKAEKKVS
jgi:hypothetical protein